jgi:NAD(P)-dependent dehydrogenase (short-subunit alcohol dehydrogenase family)
MERFSLNGKRALVTGGGTGIGYAIAQAFTHAGASVVISGRREDVLREAAQGLGERCGYQAFDVTDVAAIPAAVRSAEDRYGPIDILVNNAGINMKKPAMEVTDGEFARVLQANLNGLFAVTREVVRGMTARGKGGCVLNISSMTAIYGLPKVPAYSASKAAVLGLTRQLAVELAPVGVRVNAISPGFIFSEMTAKALDADPERKGRVMARTPMARMGRAEEVATAAVFLCSDAASFITGVNLPVDGGNSIGF